MAGTRFSQHIFDYDHCHSRPHREPITGVNLRWTSIYRGGGPPINTGPSQVNSSDWSTFPLSYCSYREMQRRSG